MKHKLAMLLLGTLFWPAAGSVLAADLAIVVLEKGSGNPVAGATVVSADGVFAETDAQGQAVLEGAALPAQLRVLAIGFEPLTLAAASSPLTLYLVPDPYQMDGLEVVEERVAEKVSKVVLSAEELQQAPGSGGDPVRAIQSLPGVVTAFDGSGIMYMRGSDAWDNSLRVNGVPVFYLYHLGGIQSTINPALVSDFNVFLGGFPVEYGDNLGGAIDVRLRAPKNDRLHQTYNIGTYQSSFLIEGPVGDSQRDSFYLAARRSYIDFLFGADDLNRSSDEDDEDPSNELVTVPRFYDAQAAWHRRLDRGTLELLYFAAGDELALLNNRSARTDPELAGELNVKMSYQTVGMNWREQWDEHRGHELVLALSEAKQRFSMGSDADGNPFFANMKAWGVHARPQLFWRPTAAERYTFGIEYEYRNYPLDFYIAEPPAPGQIDYDFTSAPKRRIDRTVEASIAAPFVKYSRRWGDLTTGVGLRYSIFRGTGDIGDETVSPRASLEYALSDRTLLTAAWGRYVQIPEAHYLLEEIGNPRLTYTEAEHRVLGVRYRLDPRWTLQLDGYHKPMRELVTSTGASPPENFSNEGTGEAYGADLLVRRQGSDGRHGWLGYSYARSERTDANGESYYFAGDQPHTLTMVWSQPLRGDWNRWRWGWRAQAASGRPYTPVVGREEETLDDGTTRFRPVYGEAYSERLPNYYRIDMRFDRRVLFNRAKLDFYFDLQNVTFRKNVRGFDYGAEYQRIDNPRKVTGLSFMPFFGIETTF